MSKPKAKSPTVEQYSPFAKHPRPDAVPAETAPEPKPEPKPEPAPVVAKAPKLDTADLARKLLAAVRARDEDVIAAVLRAVAGGGKGA